MKLYGSSFSASASRYDRYDDGPSIAGRKISWAEALRIYFAILFGVSVSLMAFYLYPLI